MCGKELKVSLSFFVPVNNWICEIRDLAGSDIATLLYIFKQWYFLYPGRGT
jgi:hypothetical protein